MIPVANNLNVQGMTNGDKYVQLGLVSSILSEIRVFITTPIKT